MRYKTITGSALVYGERALLKGFALRATSAAVVNIYDGTSSSGVLVVPINLDTNQSGISHFENLPLNDGVYVEVVSGTVIGTVWVD